MTDPVQPLVLNLHELSCKQNSKVNFTNMGGGGGRGWG